MIIPIEHLSPEAIDSLIQEYCLRDWGLNDIESPLETRFELTKKALKNGQLVVLYSEAHESAQLVEADKIQQEEG